MAILPSKLSDLLTVCASPDERLTKLHEIDLLASSASDAEVLTLIHECLNETSREISMQGFTWTTADTMIADKLSRGYLNEKGRQWLAVVEAENLRKGIVRRLWKRF